MWSDMSGWTWGWGMFGMLHMLFWWGLVVLGIVILAKWGLGSMPRNERRYSGRALEILGERYARGEINKDEYEQKKKDLAT